MNNYVRGLFSNRSVVRKMVLGAGLTLAVALVPLNANSEAVQPEGIPLSSAVAELKELTSVMVDDMAAAQAVRETQLLPVRANIRQQLAEVEALLTDAQASDNEALEAYRGALVALERSTHGVVEIPDLKLFWDAMSDLLVAWNGVLAANPDTQK